jgi:Holliday junction resolvase RusA-like endonuclease
VGTVSYVNIKISGVPYSKLKSRGDRSALERWNDAVRTQTCHLPRISEACILKVTFLLPPDKYPKNFPYGPDLDNLLKRFLDLLNETIFCDASGCDSCIVSIHAMKTRVETIEEAGANLEILPVSVEICG